MQKKKRCGRCKKIKLVKSFGPHAATASKLRSYCNLCNSTTVRKYCATRKQLHEYLSDKCCIDCGEDDIACLQFDHLKNKKHQISNMIGRFVWKTVLKEIDKCEVVCANCHAKRTAKQFKWYSW